MHNLICQVLSFQVACTNESRAVDESYVFPQLHLSKIGIQSDVISHFVDKSGIHIADEIYSLCGLNSV